MAAIFLSEWKLFDPQIWTGQKTITGVILALFSLWMILSGGPKKEEKMERMWVILITVNIILNGIGTFWGKAFLETHGPLESLISQALGGFLTLYIMNIVRRMKFSVSHPTQILAVFDGLFMMLSVTFYYAAIKNGPLIVVLPTQTIAVTITVALVGLFLFKEAQMMTKKKFIGMIVGIIGVVLLMI